MTRLKKLTSTSVRAYLPLIAALGIGYFTGQSIQEPSAAMAQRRDKPPKTAFKSGSERAEPILRDIAMTLKKIDGRVERIEKNIKIHLSNLQNPKDQNRLPSLPIKFK